MITSTFTHPVRVYWEDTDAGGIVFYANYLKFFERARTEWLRALGIHQSTFKETSGGMFVVAETTVKYLRSAPAGRPTFGYRTVGTNWPIHTHNLTTSLQRRHRAVRRQYPPVLGALRHPEIRPYPGPSFRNLQ